MPLDTELHKSAHKGDIQGVIELVESGEVHVNQKGAQDRTALHRAAGANHIGIIRFLLQAGAPVDCKDRCRRTPLHWAAISGHVDATKLLLDSGGDLRCKTMSGMNPLMCAVQQRWLSVVEAILDWSADELEEEEGDRRTPSPAELCLTKDVDGKTAVMFAKEQGDISMQKLLKAHVPQSSSTWCCGSSASEQLPAVVGSADRHAGGNAAGATASTYASGGDFPTGSGVRTRGVMAWFRRVFFFSSCYTVSQDSSNKDDTSRPAAHEIDALSSVPRGAAEGVPAALAGGKVDEPRGSAAATLGRGGDDSVNTTAASTITVGTMNMTAASAISDVGTHTHLSISDKGVHAQGGINGNGAGRQGNPSSSSSSLSAESALPRVRNSSLQGARSKPVPTEKRISGSDSKAKKPAGNSRRCRERRGGGSDEGS